MAPFWPWVREQEIKCFHGSGRQQIPDHIGTFHPQQAHVADPGGFARGTANSTEQTFDSEKILPRYALRKCAKKGAVTAAKVDVQRRSTSEDFLQIKPIDQRIDFD